VNDEACDEACTLQDHFPKPPAALTFHENTAQSIAAGMQRRHDLSDGQISLYLIFNESNTSASDLQH